MQALVPRMATVPGRCGALVPFPGEDNDLVCREYLGLLGLSDDQYSKLKANAVI